MRLILLIFFIVATAFSHAQTLDFTSNQTAIEDTFDLPWPSWVFEHWVWEDESTQESALQIVDDYIARGIPVSAIIIDSPWETDYNTFEWDTLLFPNAEAMIDSFHARDVKVLMWITGIVNIDVQPLYDYAASQDYFMKTLPFDQNPAVVNWWKGDGSLIDWFNPDAVDWWKGLMDQTLALGIDGWKTDGTDFSAIQTPWSPGANNFVSRLDYSHAYYQLHFDYTREVLGDDRVIHARPVDNYGVSDIGGEQVSFSPLETGFACWVGDQDATFEGLTWALNSMYHSADMGYLTFGSDIGGYRDDDNYPVNGRSKELFIRWAQLGTFSGLMENGGGGEHRPWMFDQETEDIYRDLVQKRYNMVNYLMTHSDAYFQQGKPLMDFFNKTDYSYMFGPDIFVSPFLEEGTSITVNFPADGPWIYLYDYSQVYEGGTSASLTIPYSEYPVFFRSGTTPLGIEANTEDLDVLVYPNPTSDFVTIQVARQEGVIAELINSSGQLVSRYNLAKTETTIDVSQMARGVYTCRVIQGESATIRKIILH